MKTIIALFALLSITYGQLSFTSGPAMAYDNGSGKWTVSFGVSEYTDVEVAVVRLTDSSIVRHLAAGKLGANPPAPFSANSLAQSIEWDGLDDMGMAVSDTAALSVRVRAGMSAALDQFVGENPYYFTGISGIAAGGDGFAYVLGSYSIFGAAWEYSQGSLTLRQYDSLGNYVRTLFPFPAGLDSAHASAWGAYLCAGGAYSPKLGPWEARVNLSDLLVSKPGARLLPFLLGGDAVSYNVVGHWPNPNRFEIQRSGVSGNEVHNNGQHALWTAPNALPACGPWMFAKGADENTLFMSGAFTSTAMTSDTGFWQDGRIYRIDLAAATVEVWRTLIPHDSIPAEGALRFASIGPANGGYTTGWAALHGMALDDSGRLFVCDRFHQEVGVYDTVTWNRLGAIPVQHPHMVEVNRGTGEVYVLSSQEISGNSQISLRKFTSWRSPAEATSLMNFMNGSTYHNQAVARMAVASWGGKPVIWVSASHRNNQPVVILRDEGASFSVVRRFGDLNTDRNKGLGASVNPAFERLAVDRKTETVYIGNGWSGFYKITDWANPAVVRCSTSLRRPLDAAEAAVSADGYLYVREGSSFTGPVTRYTQDYYHAASDLPGRASNVVDTESYGRYGAAFGDRGIAVANNGRVAVFDMQGWNDYIINVHGPDGQLENAAGSVHPIPGRAGGVKFDREGNIYMGAAVKATDYSAICGVAGDAFIDGGIGSVIKFPPTGGGISGTTVTGALKVYPFGLSYFSGGCVCRSPRFDLDPYGRLFIPNLVTSNVVVADNNGNEILSLGSYGNADSRGAGSLIPEPAIPLASPGCVAASDNYLYIADLNNDRLVRVKMNYALDNIPGIDHTGTAAGRGVSQYAPTIAAAPNPFNPSCRISIALPEAARAQLSVFDLSGRLVRTLCAKDLAAGSHSFTWNALDNAGRSVAGGIYVYRLTAGDRMLTSRAVLAR